MLFASSSSRVRNELEEKRRELALELKEILSKMKVTSFAELERLAERSKARQTLRTLIAAAIVRASLRKLSELSQRS